MPLTVPPLYYEKSAESNVNIEAPNFSNSFLSDKYQSVNPHHKVHIQFSLASIPFHCYNLEMVSRKHPVVFYYQASDTLLTKKYTER